MLRFEKRVLSLPEAVCSVLNGEVVPQLYEIEASVAGPETKWTDGARVMTYRMKRKQRPRGSPLGPGRTATTGQTPTTKPPNVVAVEWIQKHLNTDRGVMASVPVEAKTVALSRSSACGHPSYWLENFMESADLFNENKTRRSHSNNRIVFEANMLAEGVPKFLPEGDAYDLKPADMDPYLDAGVRVEIRTLPYGAPDEPVRYPDNEKRMVLCAKELAFLFQMARKGVAPCVVAAFFTHGEDKVASGVEWGQSAMAYVSSDIQTAKPAADITSMVTVTQISTFSLGSLMQAINDAPVESRKNHLIGVLSGACSSVFSIVSEMISPEDGYSMVKLNMTPESVVFCPKLVASGESWTLHGTGFMPVSKDYLDGVPKLTDFNSVFTTRVRDASFSFETSFVMHSMLLVAFAHCTYGPHISDVLWSHLLDESDPSGFVKAARNMQSKPTNASAFLAYLAANSDMRENSDLSKAMAELVSDMDCAVRDGVVASDGSLSMHPERSMFSKLVGVVTGSALPDTCLFARDPNHDNSSEMLHARALETVKHARLKRLATLKA
jgi:hypothetical protein